MLTEMGKAALIIVLVLVLLWFIMGQPRIGFNASLGKAEHMIDEDAWLEVPRGFNAPNDGVAYTPLNTLYQIEQTGHVDQVRLDSSPDI